MRLHETLQISVPPCCRGCCSRLDYTPGRASGDLYLSLGKICVAVKCVNTRVYHPGQAVSILIPRLWGGGSSSFSRQCPDPHGSSCFLCPSPCGSWPKQSRVVLSQGQAQTFSGIGQTSCGPGGCSLAWGAGAEPGGCCHGQGQPWLCPPSRAPELSPPGDRLCQGTQTVTAAGDIPAGADMPFSCLVLTACSLSACIVFLSSVHMNKIISNLCVWTKKY